MRNLLSLLLACGLPAGASVVYTIRQAPPDAPTDWTAQVEAQVMSAGYLDVPTLAYPQPGDSTSYPLQGALYEPATCTGYQITACNDPGNGTWWWIWPDVGLEAMLIGVTPYNGVLEGAEALVTFPLTAVAENGVYRTSGEFSLTVSGQPAPANAPEPTTWGLSMLGLGLAVFVRRRVRCAAISSRDSALDFSAIRFTG